VAVAVRFILRQHKYTEACINNIVKNDFLNFSR